MHEKKPQHIAIIMDGNRRWAQEQGKPAFFGHSEGAKNVERITEIAVEQGISYLTLWALSTENLKKRSKTELSHLFSLMENIESYLKKIIANGVSIKIIGNLAALPDKTRFSLERVMEQTKDNDKLVLTLAINYGGRDDIVRGVQKMMQNNLGAMDVTEELLSSYLDTAGMPDPDLVIRTGGKPRISNYMMWQIAYAEIFFSPLYWPAFDRKAFEEALQFFADIDRNFGK